MALATIAIVYRTSEAASLICTLEAAGFEVFAPDFLTVANLPHYALALGGCRIQVLESQAIEARDFVSAVIDERVGLETDLEEIRTASPRWLGHLLHVLAFFFFQVSNPLKGSFVMGERDG